MRRISMEVPRLTDRLAERLLEALARVRGVYAVLQDETEVQILGLELVDLDHVHRVARETLEPATGGNPV